MSLTLGVCDSAQVLPRSERRYCLVVKESVCFVEAVPGQLDKGCAAVGLLTCAVLSLKPKLLNF